MKHVTFLALVLAAFALMVPVASAAPRTAADSVGVIPGSFVVVYKDSVGGVGRETGRQEQELGFERDLLYRSAVKGFSAELSGRQVRALESDPDVDFVSPDRRVEATGDFSAQGSVPRMPAEPTPPTGVRRILSATATTVRQAGANTAVLDTGIQLDHPDLNAAPGTDCIDPGTPPEDGNGHGTHVAGTIGAENDGAGVSGVAPGTKVYAVRVLDNSGDGTFASIICGIDWVTANSAALQIAVANMSLGGLGSSQGTQTCATTTDAMRSAICGSTTAGVRYVVAAGNDGWDFDYAPVPNVPAVYPEVLTVSAIADSDGTPGGTGGNTTCGWVLPDDTPASFSNYAMTAAGIAHTIAAPGTCIDSTVPGSTWSSNYSGTSMASPHVAGLAALCVAENGVDGVCASKTSSETIDLLRSEAAAYNNAHPDYGFAGDPISSPSSSYYGFLIEVPVDTTPPETAIDAGPSGPTRDSTPTFSFSSDDPGSIFECRTDGVGGFAPCTSPHQLATLSEGPHSFEVRSSDAVGNSDPTPASKSFTVDTIAPTVTINSPAPGAQVKTGTIDAAFDANEPGSSFVCRMDSGSFTPCSSPKSYSGLSEGQHTIAVRATDPATNTGAATTRSFSVDLGPSAACTGAEDALEAALTNQATAKRKLESAKKQVKKAKKKLRKAKKKGGAKKAKKKLKKAKKAKKRSTKKLKRAKQAVAAAQAEVAGACA